MVKSQSCVELQQYFFVFFFFGIMKNKTMKVNCISERKKKIENIMEKKIERPTHLHTHIHIHIHNKRWICAVNWIHNQMQNSHPVIRSHIIWQFKHIDRYLVSVSHPVQIPAIKFQVDPLLCYHFFFVRIALVLSLCLSLFSFHLVLRHFFFFSV